jgi:hypothetical protein
MSRPTLYVAITSHGFGHAVRAASVVGVAQKLCPDLLPIFVTTVPRWLLASYVPGDFIQRYRAFDVGVVQSDSLQMDQEATLAKMEIFRDRASSIIAGEVNFLKTNRVDLVLGDIPPLAAPIARAAGIPCWLISNFGWDFIYRAWGDKFTAIADWISDCYSQCDRTFRLPLHEPMSAFSRITDVGLTGGQPRYPLNQLRELFTFTQPLERTLMLSFGGLGLQRLPYANVQKFPDWQFITFDANAPDAPNLLKISGHTYRPVDLMPVCGRIISKPGYSTFSEALRVGTPIISLTRDDFAEGKLLLEGIRDYTNHQIITPAEFITGDWNFLHQPLQPPRQDPQDLDKQGTEAIAQEIVKALNC